ncbi:MAG: potassium channel protein [Actinobacteria bacterium]|nr:potassium channel protein [Actinomycetota bacterium]
MVLGLGALDALYQTVTTVGTVGFREQGEADADWKIFTIVLILLGVGIVIYTTTILIETLIEGRLTDHLWRRRMQRDIAALQGHTIVCGCGRLGRTIVMVLENASADVVVVDNDERKLRELNVPFVEGDATDDAVLAAAGLGLAGTLVTGVSTDADNLYVTLSARSARPDLFIVARARTETAEPKLRRAGADRVVNPQFLGGSRIAAMTLQPNVSEFLDVVMHEDNLLFRLQEFDLGPGSPLAGRSLRDAQVRDQTGALVLALRDPTGEFLTNPPPETVLEVGQVLIAIGTPEQLLALDAARASADR